MAMLGSAEAGPSKRTKAAPKKKPGSKGHKMTKTKMEAQAVETLDKQAMDYEPPSGLSDFVELPISVATKRGLKKAYFTKLTDIQSKSIPLSLKGKDVLGAARTGSGKTLAFLVPMLEILYRRKWGPQDGLGALIISPTRELAVQIFDVLRSIGGYHTFSAGLVIGGKNLKDERDRLNRMNILVATPGRLLQHMDQTFGFECDNLQMLILDEADRILDLGFSRTLNALLGHLPKSRQTLLFSATQTDSVKDLARLSLRDPIYVGVNEESTMSAMPETLEQHYAVCELDKKLDILWSFIKSHLQSKVLVFLSSGKQVRFVFDTFCRLHPGVPLMHLHGKQKQMARLDTCKKFTSTKHAVLLATDLAARGLDFPSVDWVLQVDAPEDAATYIHRVGRTARYESSGKGLLLLCPSEEEGMLNALQKKNIKIEKIKIKGSKTQSIEKQLQNLAFQDPEIKYLGQRAFISYMRSVYLHKDKSIFKLGELPAERFAASLGLPGAPKIKFLAKEMAMKRKNAAYAEKNGGDASGSEESDTEGTGKDENNDSEEISDSGESDGENIPKPENKGAELKKNSVRTKQDRMFNRKNQSVLSEHYTKLIDHSADGAGEDDDDDFITLKRADHALAENDTSSTFELSKRKVKMGQSKKAMLKFHGLGEKLVFDEEGHGHEVYEMRDVDEEFKGKDVLEAARDFAEDERGKLRQADVQDKQEAREKRKEKKRKRKERENEQRDESSAGVELATAEDDGYESPDFDGAYSDNHEDEDQRHSKKSRPTRRNTRTQSDSDGGDSLDEDEELALKLLRR